MMRDKKKTKLYAKMCNEMVEFVLRALVGILGGIRLGFWNNFLDFFMEVARILADFVRLSADFDRLLADFVRFLEDFSN